MIQNNEVMARNLKYYMERDDVSAVEICRKLDIKQNTFSDYVNGKVYPRIDKIELLARFFNVNKACLVEADREAQEIAYKYSLASPDTQKAVSAVLGVRKDNPHEK